jgi:oxygen-independent coproporphyrinogen-3 oxidase
LHLRREIELFSEFFNKIGIAPRVKEIHLGGGSPTYLQKREFNELMASVRTIVDPKSVSEFAVEVDPRHVEEDKLGFYAEQGITRLSIGVQDFNPEVLKAVNRPQPLFLIEQSMLPEIRRLFPNGVNFDFICGLPKQTPESMRDTMRQAVELLPDRICLNYYHYIPEHVSHQRLMPKSEIPGGYMRKMIFLAALEVLEDMGYVRTGYDHFARAADRVSQAMDEGKMIWNSLGVTPGRCEDMWGVGVHSYSRLGPAHYGQNVKKKYKGDREYESLLEAGRFPVWRGHFLSKEDRVRPSVLPALRSYFSLSYPKIEEEYGLVFRDYFLRELKGLEEFERDGIVTSSEDGLRITERGEQFVNLVCREFDAYASILR